VESAIRIVLQENIRRLSEVDSKSLEIYIPNRFLKASNSDGKSEVKGDDDVQDYVAEFVKSNDQSVLLITGGSGTGKSLLFWHEYLLFKDKFKKAGEDWLPIFISLPGTSEEVLGTELLPTALSKMGLKAEEVQEIREMKRVLFFMDDMTDGIAEECRDPAPATCKVIISCRNQYLTGIPNYRRLFTSNGSLIDPTFSEVTLAPFDSKQIESFVKHYIDKGRAPDKSWTVDKMMTLIRTVPNVTELVQTPFILSMVVEVLPKMPPSGLTELKLYEQFIFQLIDKGVTGCNFEEESSMIPTAWCWTTVKGWHWPCSRPESLRSRTRSYSQAELNRRSTRSGGASSVTMIREPDSAATPC